MTKTAPELIIEHLRKENSELQMLNEIKAAELRRIWGHFDDTFDRNSGIGGTDIAGIVGLSRWKTPLSVYLEKVGLAAPPEQNFQMKMGKMLESAVAELYRQATGAVLIPAEATIRHPAIPWAYCSPDRLIQGQPAGLEIKTATSRMADQWGTEGTDEIPTDYYLQCCWNMFVCSGYFGTSYDRWDVAVLIGGSESFRIYRVEYDPEIEEGIKAAGEKFWNNHVLPRIAPAPLPADIEYPENEDDGEIKLATPEIDELFREIKQENDFIDGANARNERRKDSIKKFIGLADGAASEFGKATWKYSKKQGRRNFRITFKEEQGATDNL